MRQIPASVNAFCAGLVALHFWPIFDPSSLKTAELRHFPSASAAKTVELESNRRTSGTGGRTRAAPSTGARTGSSRTLAAASPAAASRRDRGPARAPVKHRELAAQSVERLVDDAPDRPQRMIPPDAPLHVHIGKQLPAPPIRPAIQPPLEDLARQVNHTSGAPARAVSTAC